ncbi:MAG: hypothetical protein OQL11_14410 [Gammaproteobacteria bacterium]|nr:hypothetical protein [Gammaproteobacteria bacterium]
MNAEIPANLLIIVVVQALVLITLLVLSGRFSIEHKIDWKIALGVGVGYGMLMDALLGGVGVFAYLFGEPSSGYTSPNELPIFLLVFNAVASYGLAALSVAVIAPGIIRPLKIHANLPLLVGVVLIFSLCLAIITPAHSLWLMFAWGAVVISFSELLLCHGGKGGPILAFITDRDYRPLLVLIGFSVVVGSIYEIVNIVFPFWVWLPGSSVSLWILTLLVVLLGYFVLFYPMATLYVLISNHQRKLRNNQ